MAELKLNKLDTKVEVSIIENGAEWTKLVEAAKKDLAENLEVKGFRKGQVPANIAEQHISKERTWYAAADKLIEATYSEAMELMSKEKIATRPSFDVKAVSDESIEAVLTSHLMPEVKLGDRSSISIKHEVEEVTQEEIDNEVAQLDTLLQEPKEVTGEDAAIDGDIANIDFLGKQDGVAFEGGEAKGFDLQLGSNQFIEGFEPQVVGMKIGETKDIEVTFPEAYPQAELAGKPAVFTVTLNAIKRMVPLEGEALQAKLKTFGFDSKEQIIKRIKEVAADRKAQMADDKFFKEYVDAVSELSDTQISISDEFLKQEIEAEFKRVEAQVAQQGMEMKKYLEMLGVSAEEFKETNLKESAHKRVKDGLIYATLVEELNIKAEEADIDAEYAKIAKDSKQDVEEVKKQIQPGSMESNVIFKKLVEAIK